MNIHIRFLILAGILLGQKGIVQHAQACSYGEVYSEFFIVTEADSNKAYQCDKQEEDKSWGPWDEKNCKQIGSQPSVGFLQPCSNGVCIVSNTKDRGKGSLRRAIKRANITSGPTRIEFNIPSTSFVNSNILVENSSPTQPTGKSISKVVVIEPLTPLPVIHAEIEIDGFTQPGAQTAIGDLESILTVKIDGGKIDNSSIAIQWGLPLNTHWGLHLRQSLTETNPTASKSVKGLIISNVKGPGIAVYDNNALISGNQIINSQERGNSCYHSSVGVVVSGKGNRVLGNAIGTNYDGSVDNLGNADTGIAVYKEDNNIGDPSGVAPNIIAYNHNTGITVHSGYGNSIRRNRIFHNEGVGIISPTRVNITPGQNSGLLKPTTLIDNPPLNNIFKFTFDNPTPVLSNPIVSAVKNDSYQITVDYQLSNAKTPTWYWVEFFASDRCTPPRYQEGNRFVGSRIDLTEEGGSINATWTLPETVLPGEFITATATNATTGSTSAFSECIAVP